MKSIPDTSDERNRSWCIHCSRWLTDVATNRDHVPTKGLLALPYPEHLPVVEICSECNVIFSKDEQYFVAFLGAVLTGSTAPESQTSDSARRALDRPSIRERIERSKKEYRTIRGETRVLWTPENDRIDRVILKNARGHAYYELGEPMMYEPNSIATRPFETMSMSEKAEFENSSGWATAWPEAGSRMMTRVAAGHDLENGWIVVQQGSYRYRVEQDDGIRVCSVISEYLATEVVWD
jgi:hypothetical protein